MSTLILSTALLCGLLILPVQGEGQSVVIHFEDYPPYEYLEGGVAKGVNMDLMREAFKRMDVTPSFEPMPWKRAVYELQYGGILALASGFKTPKREKFAFFPSEPLAMETLVVAALIVSGVKVDSLDDLRALRIGVIREYAYGQAFDSMRGLDKLEANSNPQLLKMLLSQRMDAIIINKSVGRHLAKAMGKLAHISFVYEVTSEPLYLFFSRAQGVKAEILSREFGKTIKVMRDDGTFAKIEAQY
ncbi:MAG: transporter substrate-binding domain-containing protein [Pseudodesulfovibrio sp.]